MSQWKPALAVLLVFVAGLVMGVEGTRMVQRWSENQGIANPQANSNRVGLRMELQLARQLQLRPLQRDRVREILSEMQGQLRMLQDETQPRRAQIISNAAARIDAVLGPVQKKKFEQLKEENRALFPPQPAARPTQ